MRANDNYCLPLYPPPPLPLPPRPRSPPPPALFLPSVRLGRVPPPVISSSVGASDQSLSSSLWSDSVSEALDASELVPWGQRTQVKPHPNIKHRIIVLFYNKIIAWGTHSLFDDYSLVLAGCFINYPFKYQKSKHLFHPEMRPLCTKGEVITSHQIWLKITSIWARESALLLHHCIIHPNQWQHLYLDLAEMTALYQSTT